jgi:hypothetical protein
MKPSTKSLLTSIAFLLLAVLTINYVFAQGLFMVSISVFIGLLTFAVTEYLLLRDFVTGDQYGLGLRDISWFTAVFVLILSLLLSGLIYLNFTHAHHLPSNLSSRLYSFSISGLLGILGVITNWISFRCRYLEQERKVDKPIVETAFMESIFKHRN